MSTVAVQRASSPGVGGNIYDYMNELYDKIAKLAFSFFERDGRVHGHDVDHWLTAEADLLNPVPFELSESEFELSVRAQVPGFTEKELEIIAEPGRLFIKGKTEKKSEEKKKKTLYSEFSSNEIFRGISLPTEIDPEKVNATLNNGVLEISMQKAMPAKKISAAAKAA
jgi:HSP20 family protein